MKKAAIIMLAAAMLPALSYAQTVDICDRTPQVRDEILVAIGASDCATVTAAQLASIAEFCFSDGCEVSYRDTYNRPRLTALMPGDFAGLSGVRRLALDFNSLTTLPEGVFDGLTGLESLGLGWNPLTELPEGVFAGLSSLKFLIMIANQLTTLPEGVFAP